MRSCIQFYSNFGASRNTHTLVRFIMNVSCSEQNWQPIQFHKRPFSQKLQQSEQCTKRKDKTRMEGTRTHKKMSIQQQCTEIFNFFSSFYTWKLFTVQCNISCGSKRERESEKLNATPAHTNDKINVFTFCTVWKSAVLNAMRAHNVHFRFNVRAKVWSHGNTNPSPSTVKSKGHFCLAWNFFLKNSTTSSGLKWSVSLSTRPLIAIIHEWRFYDGR